MKKAPHVIRERESLLWAVALFLLAMAVALVVSGFRSLTEGEINKSKFAFEFAFPLLLLGSYVALHWLRSRVEFDEDGITIISVLNRTKQILWADLDSACTRLTITRGGGRIYRLYVKGKCIEILAPIGRLDPAVKFMEKMLEGKITIRENASQP